MKFKNYNIYEFCFVVILKWKKYIYSFYENSLKTLIRLKADPTQTNNAKSRLNAEKVCAIHTLAIFLPFPMLVPRQTSSGPKQIFNLNQSYLVVLCSNSWICQKLHKRSANDEK